MNESKPQQAQKGGSFTFLDVWVADWYFLPWRMQHSKEKHGAPGGTRTPNQTVMSGPL